MTDNVRVVFRFKAEPPTAECSEWIFDPDGKSLQLGKTTEKRFEFDAVLAQDATQEEVYENHAKQQIDGFMKGFNTTIFAYGQSGSGKTYSMVGPEQVVDSLVKNFNDIPDEVKQDFGIIPRSILTIFTIINEGIEKSTFCTLKCQYLEVYNETIQDILVQPIAVNLKIREMQGQGMIVIGATDTPISTPEQVFECLALGQKNRAVCATGANSRSSRSHTVFVLSCEQKLKDGTIKLSKLNLVDLAGSEKLNKAQTTGQQLEETKRINQSLTSLGMCIMALTGKQKQHVPFRDSKLTMILKESLGGNSKTLMMCTGSMLQFNEEETVSSLRFAQRAKKIVNKAKNNVKRGVAELEEMVELLKKELSMVRKKLKKQNQQLASTLEYIPSDDEYPDPDEIKFQQIQIVKDAEIEDLKVQLELAHQNKTDNKEVQQYKELLQERDSIISLQRQQYESRMYDLETKMLEYRDRCILAEQEKKVLLKETHEPQPEQISEIVEDEKIIEKDTTQKVVILEQDYKSNISKIQEQREKIKQEREALYAQNLHLKDQLVEINHKINYQQGEVENAVEDLKIDRYQLTKIDTSRTQEILDNIAFLKEQIQRLQQENEDKMICEKVLINYNLFGKKLFQ